MSKTIRYIITILLTLAGTGIWGQSKIELPYFNGFEDSDENEHWVSNSGADCVDKWYIGTATQREGDSAIYISAAGRDSIVCGDEKNVVIVYRKISFDTQTQCDISFDWMNMVDASESQLYVSIYPVSSGEPLSKKGTIAPQPSVALSKESQSLRGDGNWSTETFKCSFPFDAGKEYYLAFVWINNEQKCRFIPGDPMAGTKDTTICVEHFGAAVDNIQITQAGPKAPYDIDVVGMCDTALVRWRASAVLFDFEYREAGVGAPWIKYPGVKGASGQLNHTFRIDGIAEGVYDFRIRTIQPVGSDTLHSVWTYKYSALVFCAANHCFNYIDIHDTTMVRCYGGSSSDGRGLFPIDAVDHGYRSVYSRHTVHYLQSEIDPRTKSKDNSGLHTVPPGELASVRVGNWSGTQMDGIEYTLPITKGMEVLLLKYAVVLQDPTDDGHTMEQRPYFGLELYDKEGNLIDPDCGVVHFYSDKTKPNWHTVPNVNGVIVWNDWTTVGFNLQKYVGDTVRVRVVVKDCFFTVHFGYGYFTLGCTSAEIKGISCGSGTSMDLKAPEGFDYAWFAASDTQHTDTLTKEQVFTATDTREYECVMMFRDPEKQHCGLSVPTKAYPRIPFADYAYAHVPDTCHNYIRLTNRSHVLTRDENGNEIPSGETTDDIHWTIDGIEYTTPEVTIEVPQQGGKVEVRLECIIEGGCDDDTIYTYTVPSILTPLATIDTTLCYGATFRFCNPAQTFGVVADTTIRCELTNRYGCDSITVINVHALPQSPRQYIPDTVCHGEVSDLLSDTLIYTPGRHEIRYTNRYGCDSIIVLDLCVLDEISFSLSSTPEEITPQSGTITIDCQEQDYTWSLNGEMNAPLTGLRGGDYEVIVYNSHGCPSQPQTITVARECVELTIDPQHLFTACSGDSVISIDYTHIKGILSHYTIRYSPEAHAAGFTDTQHTFAAEPQILLTLPTACPVNNYTAEILVGDVVCDTLRLPLRFQVRYPADIVRQKWNDVLAVTNEYYNGGHTFSQYQWYRNDVAIPGATQSYYYIDNGLWLDTASHYHVLLTRTTDGVAIPSCPLDVVHRTDVSPHLVLIPATASPSALLPVSNAPDGIEVHIYDTRGILHSSCTLTDGCIRMPAEQGIYIIVLHSPAGRSAHKIAVY